MPMVPCDPLEAWLRKFGGATSRDSSIVGIPVSNRRVVPDLMVREGARQLINIQIFSLSDFDQALALAKKSRDAKTQGALDAFAEIQKEVNSARSFSVLKSKKNLAKLQHIIDTMPNHISARMLYLYATGRAPKVYSLPGSLQEIDKLAMKLLAARKNTSQFIGDDDLSDAISGLRSVRSKLDKRTHKYCDAIVAFGSAFRSLKESSTNSTSQRERAYANYKRAIAEVIDAEKKLRSNPEVMEELMQ